MQETRLWDSAAGRTLSMRSKEEAHDYRYFPEPDLPPLVVDAARIDAVRGDDAGAARGAARAVRRAVRLPDYDAGVLTQSAALADYFEAVAAAARQRQGGEQLGHGRAAADAEGARRRRSREVPLTPDGAGRPDRARRQRARSAARSRKDVFAKMYDSGRSADDIVAAEGLAQIGDEGALLAIVRDVIARNADAVAQYRAGKQQTFGFLVGQVMKASGGKANPKVVNELLRELRLTGRRMSPTSHA